MLRAPPGRPVHSCMGAILYEDMILWKRSFMNVSPILKVVDVQLLNIFEDTFANGCGGVFLFWLLFVVQRFPIGAHQASLNQ